MLLMQLPLPLLLLLLCCQSDQMIWLGRRKGHGQRRLIVSKCGATRGERLIRMRSRS